METIKPATDGRGIIVRLFEAHGGVATTRLKFGSSLKSCDVVSIFEDFETRLHPVGDEVEVLMNPFQILTLRVEFQNA